MMMTVVRSLALAASISGSGGDQGPAVMATMSRSLDASLQCVECRRPEQPDPADVLQGIGSVLKRVLTGTSTGADLERHWLAGSSGPYPTK